MELKIHNIAFRYASTPIIEDVCMEIAGAEFVVICGPNGVGKSTLIRCMNKILRYQTGSVLLDGREITSMSMRELARHMGYVAQNSSGVFPVTVFDMILMGRRPYLGWRSNDADVDKVTEILHLMEIEELALCDFNELSGGQQQKVVISRALAQEPDILLLDEPTSNLDIKHQLEVMDILRNLVAEKSVTVIMTIHDLNLASRYADKVMMMKDGKVFSVGDPTLILTPENILSVYGIESVVKSELGKPYIVPIKHSKRKEYIL